MPELRKAAPPYVQITGYYLAKIRRGEYAPGETLPSGRQIREEWNVAKGTANRVSLLLQSEGVAESVPGVGLVVTANTPKTGVCPCCGRPYEEQTSA